MDYRCAACKKTIQYEELRRRISCPYCGHKIIFKKRPKMKKEVLAI